MGSRSDHIRTAFARALGPGLACKSGWYSPRAWLGCARHPSPSRPAVAVAVDLDSNPPLGASFALGLLWR